MLPSWANDIITVLHANLIDERGTKIYDWDNAERHVVSGCSVQPSTASTAFDTNPPRENQVYSQYVVYIPPTSEYPVAGDRIEWNGEIFAMQGKPMVWNSPTGSLSHKVIYMKHFEG